MEEKERAVKIKNVSIYDFAVFKKLEEAGNTEHIGKYFAYPNSNAAFNAACSALRDILEGL